MTSFWKILAMAVLGMAVSQANAAAVGNGGRTLLLLLDGLRWDYLSKTSTPNFDKFISEGVQVEQVTNAFTTMTMANLWTIVTGMYAEDHGVIANKFYDSALNDTYYFSWETKWYNSTEPIWITSEKEGKKAGTYQWAGNQAMYDGMNTTRMIPFAMTADFEEGVDIVVNWLASDKLSLVCMYTDQPDLDGHEFGPDSDEVKSRIQIIDGILGRLMKKLENKGLTESVNIMIASDHGMTDVGKERSIALDAYVDADDIEWWHTDGIGLLYPKPGRLEKVFNSLKAAEASEPHMKVYKKEDVPVDRHYRNNSRIPDIVILPDNGWLLLKKASDNVTIKGHHGFDNKQPDMKTTFLAKGPNFKCGYKQKEMRIVDLYPLMCEVLGLRTCHNSRGDLENTKNLLSKDKCPSDPNNGSEPYGISITCVVLLAFLSQLIFHLE